MNNEDRTLLLETRFSNPETIANLAQQRQRRTSLSESGRLLIVAADHPARGAINVGSRSTTMGNRYDVLDRLVAARSVQDTISTRDTQCYDVLDRLVAALSVPGADGVLGTPDIIEDLLLLGALENKVVFGSMNRGGLSGAVFEMDDRFTAYTPASIVGSRLDGGKMLLRINLTDPGTANTLRACACAFRVWAAAGRIAMLGPFMNQRTEGPVKNELTTEAVIRSAGIASALGSTSAYTWLKLTVVDDMSRVAEAATLPLVLLGGEQSDQPDEMFGQWEKALQLPGVRGLVVGRNLLYPPDDDVVAAVKTAVSLL